MMSKAPEVRGWIALPKSACEPGGVEDVVDPFFLAHPHGAALHEKVRVAPAGELHARRTCHERKIAEPCSGEFPATRFRWHVDRNTRSPTDAGMHANAVRLCSQALGAQKLDPVRFLERTRQVPLVLDVGRRDRGALGVHAVAGARTDLTANER